MSEAKVLQEIRLAASQIGARLFRNQVGTYKLADGRVISSGMGKGSSDLIGWKTIEVTEAMVGKPIAVFVAIECKDKKKKATAEQQNFIDVVNKAGGFAAVCNSDDSFRKAISWLE